MVSIPLGLTIYENIKTHGRGGFSAVVWGAYSDWPAGLRSGPGDYSASARATASDHDAGVVVTLASGPTVVFHLKQIAPLAAVGAIGLLCIVFPRRTHADDTQRAACS